MEKIIIEIDKDFDNSFTVRQGDRYCDRLTYDEMLGTVSALTMPEKRPCLHWMRTKEEWCAWHSNIKRAMKQTHENEV